MISVLLNVISERVFHRAVYVLSFCLLGVRPAGRLPSSCPKAQLGEGNWFFPLACGVSLNDCGYVSAQRWTDACSPAFSHARGEKGSFPFFLTPVRKLFNNESLIKKNLLIIALHKYVAEINHTCIFSISHGVVHARAFKWLHITPPHLHSEFWSVVIAISLHAHHPSLSTVSDSLARGPPIPLFRALPEQQMVNSSLPQICR